MITQEKLKETFDYKDGEFYTKESRGRLKAGFKAGCKTKRGYIAIRIDGKPYLAHRLVWLYHHGYMPPMIDHIDNNKTNNHITNLRIATASQNQHNRIKNKNNTTGVKGLSIAKVKYKDIFYTYWRAAILNDGISTVKTFHSRSKAVAFLKKARPEIHGEYARFK